MCEGEVRSEMTTEYIPPLFSHGSHGARLQGKCPSLTVPYAVRHRQNHLTKSGHITVALLGVNTRELPCDLIDYWVATESERRSRCCIA